MPKVQCFSMAAVAAALMALADTASATGTATVAASAAPDQAAAAVLPFCDALCRDAVPTLTLVQQCIGYRYGTHGLRVDYPTMDARCREAAAQGDATAQTLLGESRFLGLGVAQDFTAAYAWYQRAAAQQHPHAELMLYEMTRLQLAPESVLTPVQWLQRAAEDGHPQALARLQAAL